MKLTPLDIRQKRFANALRGLDRREVEAFQELLAAEFEDLVKENIALKEDLKRMQLQLEQHQEKERTLQETMVTAQRISEDLRAAAKKEADIVLAEAELQAERIVQGAQDRLGSVINDIQELKRQRAQFEAQVRAIVDSHGRLLDAFQDANAAERAHSENNLAFLPSSKARAAQGE